NALRKGRRSSSTRKIAALDASVASTNVSRPAIVDLLQQLAQFGNVGIAQPAVAAEVRDQWRDPAVEQSIEQAFPFPPPPAFALQHRAVQIAPAVLLGADQIGRASCRARGYVP